MKSEKQQQSNMKYIQSQQQLQSKYKHKQKHGQSFGIEQNKISEQFNTLQQINIKTIQQFVINNQDKLIQIGNNIVQKQISPLSKSLKQQKITSCIQYINDLLNYIKIKIQRMEEQKKNQNQNNNNNKQIKNNDKTQFKLIKWIKSLFRTKKSTTIIKKIQDLQIIQLQAKHYALIEINKWYKSLSQYIVKKRQQKLYQQVKQFNQYFKQRKLKKVNYSIDNINILCKHFYSNSSIITNQKHAQEIIYLFNQQITNVKLVYKASQNNFDMDIFYNKCKKLKNTLFICHSEGGSILGGYTPLQFNYSGLGYQNQFDLKYNQQSVFDESRTSFIFNITSGVQLFLRKNKPAIKNSIQNQSIKFGHFDFGISNKSNMNDDSYLTTSQYFLNSSYWDIKQIDKNHKQDKIFDLSGVNCLLYRLIQWQVWQIQTKKQLIEQ